MRYFATSFVLSIFPAVLLYKALPYAGKNALVFLVLIALVYFCINKIIASNGYHSVSTAYLILLGLAGIFLLSTLYYQIPGFSSLYTLPEQISYWAKMDNAYFISLALPFLIIFFLG